MTPVQLPEVPAPLAYTYQDRAADGVWEDQCGDKLPPWEHRNAVQLYTAAQLREYATDYSAPFVGELRDLYRAYVRLLESGRDRIMDLGGSCDPVDVMERNDPYLIRARRTLALLTPSEPNSDR